MAKYKFGLALSGGGMRGVAHVGVLKALNEIGLKPDVVSGVSAGAIVGAMYTDGRSIEEMVEFFEKSSFTKGVKLNMPKNGGFASAKGYKRYLDNMIQAETFEDLKTPLIVNATDLMAGSIAYFTSGNLVDAVVASASVPVLFNPAKIGSRYYVDGGFLCNLPAEVLRSQCDFVMGVHVNPIWPMPNSTKMGLVTVTERVFHLAVNGNTYKEKSFCDLVIDMKPDKEVGMFEASKSDYMMQMGYETAMEGFKNFDFSRFGLACKVF